ncbi:MAG: RimK family alpha-L-glutamate ligase [Deltaproteobacteria bacterium]|nr:RimK family alpha-L-glutamate ligase [Deltaproteobacteria bacterium]
MAEQKQFIALGSRLLGIPEVLTLGVKPNFLDYTPAQRELIHAADLILFPTVGYAQFFNTMGKKIFPSLETHLYADEKIMQTTLFYLQKVSHPRTRFYYPLHHGDIVKDFAFPFVGKIPRRSAQGRGVFLIREKEALKKYLSLTRIAYIQEYLPHEKDLRVILLNYDPVLAYWRVRQAGNFRANLFQGGKISFEDVPSEGIALAREAALKCRFDDVGMDLIRYKNNWYVIEANMKYGRKGLNMKGLDIKQLIRKKLLLGELTAAGPCLG